MRKLVLSLEDLNVESFSVQKTPTPRGTVGAAQYSVPVLSLCSACGGTCGQTCDESTCMFNNGASCDPWDSCNVTDCQGGGGTGTAVFSCAEQVDSCGADCNGGGGTDYVSCTCPNTA